MSVSMAQDLAVACTGSPYKICEHAMSKPSASRAAQPP